MARLLSQTLIRDSSPLLRCRTPLLSLRFQSSRRPEEAQLVEIDLDAEASAAGAGRGGGAGEVEVELVGRRLEDAIHGMIVRRAAPDWLPFLPGSSYWVPPRKGSLRLVEVIGRIAASSLTEEEALSLTTVRGWPSSAYFVEGVAAESAERPLWKKPAAQSDDEE